MKVVFVLPSRQQVAVEASEGDTLMYAAVTNDVRGIDGECGGSMMCGTCHVYVEEPYLSRLPEPSVGEVELLDCAVLERRENSRLSCQIKASPKMEGIVVSIPERQR